MNEHRSSRRRKRNANSGVQPLVACLPAIIGDIQAQQRRAHGKAVAGSWHSGQEITVLGRLLYHWEEIVGPALVRNTRPRRLFQGQLLIACRDSAWLHTLTYLKPQIKERLQKLFPHHQITVVRGRIEPLAELPEGPTPVVWPTWENHADIPLPATTSSIPLERVQICRKKLLARQEGLCEQGWHPCAQCHAVWVKGSGDICAVCRHGDQLARLRHARSLLDSVPWLTTQQLMGEILGLTDVEAELTRQDLIEEARQQMPFVLAELSESSALYKDYLKLRKELLHLVFLHTCQAPDRIHDTTWLDCPVLEQSWVERLSTIRNALHAHPFRK